MPDEARKKKELPNEVKKNKNARGKKKKKMPDEARKKEELP